MKIMFYSPHAAIWQHAFPEALVAESLMQSGNEIVYIGCGRRFSRFCVAMSAYGLKYDSPESQKKKVCDKCEKNKIFLRREFGLGGTDIADEISGADLCHAEDLLKKVTPENYLSFEFSGIQVGKLALYEFLLSHKKNSLEIGNDKWPEYLDALRNSLLSVMAATRLLERENPDRLIAYNTFYSVNHACCMVAEKLYIPHYLLHAGNNVAHRLETLTLTKGYSYNFITRHPEWVRYREIPCSGEQIGKVTDHLLALFAAKSAFVYSSPKSGKDIDLKKKFGVREDQKVLVATKSSHDERFAAVAIGVMPHDNDLVFPTQIDWVGALTEFVSRRPDLFLIIRVHPREFPNKRESVLSEYASKLKDLLVDLPDNTAVNWPSDQISLYDIAGIADLFLNSRSTTGMEMSLLGLPVVLYSPNQLYSYPSDLNYSANSREEYFVQIDRALIRGWDIEFSRKAFRWGGFQYCRATLDISESFRGEKSLGTSRVSLFIYKSIRKLFPIILQKLDCWRRAKRLKSGKIINDYLASGKDSIVELERGNFEVVTLEQETSALKREFERIILSLYPSGGSGEVSSLYSRMLTFINSVEGM